jgi:hypothetical protein
VLDRGGLGLVGEHARHSLDRLLLPGVDQRLMDTVLGDQLRNAQLTTDRLQRDLGLELGRVPLPLPRHRVRPLEWANQA